MDCSCASPKSLCIKWSSSYDRTLCRFGLPHTIISDNRTNFTSNEVATFCAKYNSPTSFLCHTTHKATVRPRSTIIPSSTACAKASVRQGQMGRTASESTLGVSGHQARFYGGDSVFPSLRDKGHHPRRHLHIDAPHRS